MKKINKWQEIILILVFSIVGAIVAKILLPPFTFFENEIIKTFLPYILGMIIGLIIILSLLGYTEKMVDHYDDGKRRHSL